MMTIKTIRQITRLSHVRLTVAIAAALALAVVESGRSAVQAQSNPIVVENAQTGASDWEISGAGDPTIQGFATDISVNQGGTVNFKIATDSTNFMVVIYRIGYYGGLGARKIKTLGPFTAQQNWNATANAPTTCLSDAATGLYDCGNWNVSASWDTNVFDGLRPPSGIYVANLTRLDVGGSSHIVFIVRDDARPADVVVQTSDTTWQAYNRYGIGGPVPTGSLYCGGPISNADSEYVNACATRSTKVSYNRPIDTRAHDPQSFLFNAEYPMVRFLEANGYDVKYWAGVDTDRRGADLVNSTLRPKALLSVGHDEYWSGDQRTRIENARNAGVSLAFFSGNEMYWKTRYEPSIDGFSTAYRTLVSYKESLASAKTDPAVDGTGRPIWTGTWRDPRFSPPADGGRPENGVTGNIWTVNSGTSAITVPAEMAHLRFWRNTRVAALTSGVATLSPDSLGYEWDEDLDNGARPAGLVHLSSTTVDGVQKILDFGATTGTGSATHSLTLYRHNSGAFVFGAGTVQWSWGLDDKHDRGAPEAHVPDQAIQQSTVNLLADMGAQPATLQSGLTSTSPSTDLFAPTSVITSPAAGGQVQSGNRVTINGTATDNGGGAVASVEVSVDGGATWRVAQTTWNVAQATATWSVDWPSPGPLGPVTIRSRAIDDSGNMEAAAAGVTVSVVAGNCPCTSLWKPSVVPTVQSAADTNAIELGVKFKSEVDGFITGVRFYRGPANTGTHQGSLWTLSGTRLATAVFTGETGTGWQQVTFATPVHITANTMYVASYHTNVGGYSADGGYFSNAGVDSYPLHAPPANISGRNGVFKYGASVFPTQSFNDTNYWVDVVFAEAIVDATPLGISNIGVTVIDGSTAAITWRTSKDATSRIDYSTDPSLPALPAGLTLTKTDGAFVMQHSLTLTGLTFNSTYYFNITAVDGSGETTVSTAPSFTVPGPTLHDTASVDFLAPGSTRTNTYVSQTADGEVILAPTSGSEFSGPALPAGWVEMAWDDAGYSIIDNGVLLVDGARVATCVTDTNGACVPGETITTTLSAIFTSPHSLEFSAKFSGDQSQHAGFGNTLASGFEPWAIFSTLSGGQLYARTNPGSGSVDTPLGTGLLGSFHRFRIDWKADSIDYYVDGALVASHALSITLPMRPIAASDFNPSGGVVFVDWMRMAPYAASGSFVSRVFDARSPVDWRTIQWVASAPLATSIAISVRTGSTPTPPADGTASADWTAFVPVLAPGRLTQHSQFIQYRAEMTTSDPNQTPQLDHIIISTNDAPVAVDDAARTLVNTPYTFRAAGPICTGSSSTPCSLTSNDTADTSKNPDVRLRVIAVTTPAHGSATLNANGSVTYRPAVDFSGNDSFTYTVSDGLLTAIATVRMTVAVTIDSTPTITWPNPAAITYGTPLGASQLNATASVSGSFAYNPGAGTVLGAGLQTLGVTFTPTDPTQPPVVSTAQITVNPAPLTVTADNQTKAYGAANPPLTSTITGFVNGDTFASLGGTLTFTTAATAASPVGTYAITPAGLTSSNYTISFVNGTLTISQATTTTSVSSSSSSLRFGAPITLTATVSIVAPGAGTPTGSVTFMDGATAISGAVALGAGVATFTTSSLAVGTHTITAIYSGDTNVIGGTSSGLPIMVNPDLTWTTTTTADFSAGTLASTYISETTDGEVILAPTKGTEFSGTSLPPGWVSTQKVNIGTVTVGNGSAKLSGVLLTTSTLYGVGRSLEFVATLSGAPDQSAGLLLAQFLAKTNGSTVSLYVTTVSVPAVQTLIPGNWFTGPHRFRIDWNATNIVYWIDGTVVATHNVTFPLLTKMSVMAQDLCHGAGLIAIDWMRVTPYAASGTYTSKVLDAGGLGTWMNASWTADTPAGTNVVVSYRIGNTPTPDATWTSFATVPSSGAALSGTSRYFQFQLKETTTKPGQTPAVKDVTVVYR